MKDIIMDDDFANVLDSCNIGLPSFKTFEQDWPWFLFQFCMLTIPFTYLFWIYGSSVKGTSRSALIVMWSFQLCETLAIILGMFVAGNYEQLWHNGWNWAFMFVGDLLPIFLIFLYFCL